MDDPKDHDDNQDQKAIKNFFQKGANLDFDQDELNALENQIEEDSKKEAEKMRKIRENNIPRTPEDRKDYENTVKERYNEYNEAKNYFEKYNLFDERHDKVLNDLKIIERELKNIRDENWTDTDKDNLPKKITPTYIYNCLKEKRDKLFEEIINKINNKILVLKLKKAVLDSEYKKFSRMFGKNKILEKKPKLVKNCIDTKNKLEKYEKIKTNLEKNLNEVWAPPPSYIETKNPKITTILINEQNTFKITVKIENNKLKLLMNFFLNETLINENNDPITTIDFEGSFSLTLQKDEFNSIYKKILYIEPIVYGFFSNTKKDRLEIDLEDLKQKNIIKKVFNLNQNINEQDSIKINVEINTNRPCEEYEYDYQVTIYPPFNSKNDINYNVIIDKKDLEKDLEDYANEYYKEIDNDNKKEEESKNEEKIKNDEIEINKNSSDNEIKDIKSENNIEKNQQNIIKEEDIENPYESINLNLNDNIDVVKDSEINSNIEEKEKEKENDINIKSEINNNENFEIK